MVLGYQSAGQTSTGALPAEPASGGGACGEDEIDHVTAEPASAWHSADSHKSAHPFNAIDKVSVVM